MPKTYDECLNDLNQSIAHSKFAEERERIILNEKPFFSFNEVGKLKDRINRLELNQWFAFFAGLSLGAILTIVIIHYT